MKDDGVFQLGFRAMGTQCQIHFRASSVRVAEVCRDEMLRWVRAFEAKFSRFQPDSVITLINAQAGGDWVKIDEETEKLIQLGETVFFLSEGLLDATSLPLTRLWKRAGDTNTFPEPGSVERTVEELVGWSKVERRPGELRLPVEGMALDLGGYGKEYAVDRAAEIAARHGVEHVLVDFGRDVFAAGSPPDLPYWVIGLEDAFAPAETRGRLALSDKGVASSGNYRRFFEIDGEQYGHLINPRTGYPVESNLGAVTCVADTCLRAGIAATTTCLLGGDEGETWLRRFPDVEGVIQKQNQSVETPRFHVHVIPEDS